MFLCGCKTAARVACEFGVKSQSGYPWARMHFACTVSTRGTPGESMPMLPHPDTGLLPDPGGGDGATNPGAKSGGMGPPTRFPEQASYAAS